MRLSFLRSQAFYWAVPVIVGVCAVQTMRVPLVSAMVSRIELMTFDWRVQLAHHFNNSPSENTTNLGLVEISDRTIYEVKHNTSLGFNCGLYWARDVYAAALKELTLEGASVVAFDVLFGDPRDDLAMTTLPDGSIKPSDDVLADQIKESGNVILATDSEFMPLKKFWTNAWSVASIFVDHDSEDGVLRKARAYKDIPVYDPRIQDAAAQLQWDLSKTVDDRTAHKIAFFSELESEKTEYPTDEDGRIDATNFLATVRPGTPDKIVPYTRFRAWAMGIQMAAHELHLDLEHPDFSEPGVITLRGTNGITRSIPVDEEGYFYIDWAITPKDHQLIHEGPFEYLLVRLNERKKGQPVVNEWSNRVVVIGSTTTGNDLSDMGATPLESTYLVSKHLNVANSVMMGRFVHRTPLVLKLALIVIIGIFAAWVTSIVEKPYNSTFMMMGFAAVYMAASALLYLHWRLWVPIFLPMVCAGVATHVAVLVHRVRFEQSQKKIIKNLFARVLSPDVVEEVSKAGTIKIEGQSREITVLFADVRGFTELTDLTQEAATQFVKENNLTGAEAEAHFDAQAKEVLATVSTYLGIIADTVKAHKGTFDKYIGDCVMAFWGAPLSNPKHALEAVRAAIDAQRAMAEFNQEREKENARRETENTGRALRGEPLLRLMPVKSMGTGINTGPAIVGFMGSDKHQANYTAFGREVNLASRLEGVSGHGRIIIGEATFLALQRDDPELAGKCLEWAPRTVKGFRTPVRIYEVVWRPPTGILQQPGENTDIRITKSGEEKGAVKD